MRGVRVKRVLRYSWFVGLVLLVVAVQFGVFSPGDAAMKSQTTLPVSTESSVKTLSTDIGRSIQTFARPSTVISWCLLDTAYGADAVVQGAKGVNRCSKCCKDSKQFPIHFRRVARKVQQ
jgi:hypothetical protein